MHIFKPISHPFLHPSHPFLSLLSTLFRAYPTDPDQCGNEDQIMVADRSHFIELFEKMTSSAREQKEVAEDFRSLTKRTLPSRAPIRTSSILTENAYRGRSNDLLELISQVKHGNASPSEQQFHFRQEQSHARPLWALQSPPYYPKPPARFQLISAPDDKCERESVPLKPGIHAVERLNQNTKPSSLVELCSRESPHACHSTLFPPWCLVSGS